MYMYLKKLLSKKNVKKIMASCHLSVTEKSRIWFRKSVVQIRGSGSVPKCHGSTTLQSGDRKNIEKRRKIRRMHKNRK